MQISATRLTGDVLTSNVLDLKYDCSELSPLARPSNRNLTPPAQAMISPPGWISAAIFLGLYPAVVYMTDLCCAY